MLGHGYCGAIKSAISGVELGNITALLRKIQPAILTEGKSFNGEKKSSNPAFVQAVCVENVRLAVGQIRSRSTILNDMEKAGDIKIIGAIYDMNTGKVDFLD